jgi:hypothetical protein
MSHANNEPTGAQLREAGVEACLAGTEAAHRQHVRLAVENAFEICVERGDEFDADDVQRLIPDDVRKLAPPNLLPSLFAHASAAGRIALVGYATSHRPSRHGGVFRRWRRADTDVA